MVLIHELFSQETLDLLFLLPQFYLTFNLKSEGYNESP